MKEIAIIDKKGIEPKKPLKPNIEKFCILFAQSGVATTAYCEAYGIDKTDSSGYFGAAASASALLKNPKIQARLQELMTKAGFTDDGMDGVLNHLAHRYDNPQVQIAAVKEYNNLRKRTGQTAKSMFSGNTFNLTQLIREAAKDETGIIDQKE